MSMEEYDHDYDYDEEDLEASAKCKRCALGDFVPLVVLTMLMMGYCLLGGFVFAEIENNCEGGTNSSCPNPPWTLSNGLEYAVTLVTTIGYGHIVTASSVGKIVTIVYGAFGIPLFFACYIKIGKIMAHLVLCIYKGCLCGGLCKRGADEDDDDDGVNNLNTMGSRVSTFSRQVSKVEKKKADRGRFGAVILGVVIFIGYIVGTSFLLQRYFDFGQKVTILDAFYFNFATVSLTGFGDYTPQLGNLFQLEDMNGFWTTFVFYVYLSNGIGLLFMNVFLVRLEVNRLWFVIKTRLSIV